MLNLNERRSSTPALQSSTRQEIVFKMLNCPRSRKSGARFAQGFLIYVLAEASRKLPENKKLQLFPSIAQARTNLNSISQSAEATRKRFPLQHLLRKEPFMPRKPLRTGFDISLRSQLDLKHCSNECVFVYTPPNRFLFSVDFQLETRNKRTFPPKYAFPLFGSLLSKGMIIASILSCSTESDRGKVSRSERGGSFASFFQTPWLTNVPTRQEMSLSTGPGSYTLSHQMGVFFWPPKKTNEQMLCSFWFSFKTRRCNSSRKKRLTACFCWLPISCKTCGHRPLTSLRTLAVKSWPELSFGTPHVREPTPKLGRPAPREGSPN